VWERVVAEQDALAQRLESRALHRVPGVRPGEQDLLTLILSELTEARVPAVEQPRKAFTLGVARIAANRLQHRLGDADFRCRWKPVAAGRKGVADRIEGPPRACAHSQTRRALHTKLKLSD
jgi:hypothetical protein